MKRRVGIEISATAVRLAELEMANRPRLVAFAERPLPRGAVADGGVVQVDVVRDAIAACIAETHLRRRHLGAPVRAHLGVAGLRAITREIEMPHLADDELDAAVRLQAYEIVPFPIESAVLSARRLRPVEGAEPPMDRVLLAAAHRDLVEPAVAAAEAAGVIVEGVEFAPFALVRALADPELAGAEAIISIGSNLTTVVIHDEGDPLLVRTVAAGGASVTRAIAAALDLPFGDAEEMKLRLGEEAGAERLPVEAVAAARDSSMALIAEIRSSLQYFSSLPDSAGCARVLLTGGGSLLGGLYERLAQQLPVPVVRRGCFEHLELKRRRSGAMRRLEATGAVVVGSALPAAPGTKSIDLLPPEVPAARRRHAVERRVVTAAVVLALALAGGGALRYLQLRSARASVTAYGQAVALLRVQIPRYDAVAREHAALVTDAAIAAPLVEHEVNWPAVIQVIDKYTPAGVQAGAFSGSASTSGAPTTTAAVASAPTTGGEPAADSSAAAIGSVSLTFTGSGYPSFQQWFSSVSGSGALQIVQFSGVSTTGKGVSFSAELAVTGEVKTSRAARFHLGGSDLAP